MKEEHVFKALNLVLQRKMEVYADDIRTITG
jgi:hypothetical protein